jgi:hypothetical protein
LKFEQELLAVCSDVETPSKEIWALFPSRLTHMVLKKTKQAYT